MLRHTLTRMMAHMAMVESAVQLLLKVPPRLMMIWLMGPSERKRNLKMAPRATMLEM